MILCIVSKHLNQHLVVRIDLELCDFLQLA